MCCQCKCECKKTQTLAELSLEITNLTYSLQAKEKARKMWMDSASIAEIKVKELRKTITELRTTIKTLVNFKETENV